MEKVVTIRHGKEFSDMPTFYGSRGKCDYLGALSRDRATLSYG